jgi:hypothetical protein
MTSPPTPVSTGPWGRPAGSGAARPSRAPRHAPVRRPVAPPPPAPGRPAAGARRRRPPRPAGPAGRRLLAGRAARASQRRGSRRRVGPRRRADHQLAGPRPGHSALRATPGVPGSGNGPGRAQPAARRPPRVGLRPRGAGPGLRRFARCGRRSDLGRPGTGVRVRDHQGCADAGSTLKRLPPGVPHRRGRERGPAGQHGVRPRADGAPAESRQGPAEDHVHRGRRLQLER